MNTQVNDTPSPMEREVLGTMRAGASPDVATIALVRRALALLHERCTPRHIARRFTLYQTENELSLQGAGLTLPGQDIIKHLQGCAEAYLLAATMGVASERLFRETETLDPLLHYALDAAAGRVLERYIDGVVNNWTAAGVQTIRRYSPGYGDLPLSLQPGLLTALEAEKTLGLWTTESHMLIPQKSVTAIAGIKAHPHADE